MTRATLADFAGYRGKGGEVEGTTGGVWGATLAEFAGYRGRGVRWRGRLEGSGGHLWLNLPGIGEGAGGEGRKEGRRADER